MTADEVIDFFAPDSTTTDAVMEWIASSGIGSDRAAVSVNKQVSSQLSFPRATGLTRCCSGSSLMQLLPKWRNSCSPSFMSGSITRELLISQQKNTSMYIVFPELAHPEKLHHMALLPFVALGASIPGSHI